MGVDRSESAVGTDPFILNWRIFVAAKSEAEAKRLFTVLEEVRGGGFRTTHLLRYFKDTSLWEAAANEFCYETTPERRLMFAVERAQALGRDWCLGKVDTKTGECDLIFDRQLGSRSDIDFLRWVNVHLWPPGLVSLDSEESGDSGEPSEWNSVPMQP